MSKKCEACGGPHEYHDTCYGYTSSADAIAACITTLNRRIEALEAKLIPESKIRAALEEMGCNPDDIITRAAAHMTHDKIRPSAPSESEIPQLVADEVATPAEPPPSDYPEPPWREIADAAYALGSVAAAARYLAEKCVLRTSVDRYQDEMADEIRGHLFAKMEADERIATLEDELAKHKQQQSITEAAIMHTYSDMFPNYAYSGARQAIDVCRREITELRAALAAREAKS